MRQNKGFMTYDIRDHERGLRFRRGRFAALEGPGRVRLWSRLVSRSREALEIVSALETKFEHEQLPVLVRHESLRRELEVLELTDAERALVWRDGRLAFIVGPGQHAFWKDPYRLEIEMFNVDESVRFEHRRLDAILEHPKAPDFLHIVEVGQNQDALVYRDGNLLDRAPPGRRAYWRGAGRISWFRIEGRECTLDVSGQEIMTRDKVTLRLNLIVTYRVVDPLRSVTVVTDADQSLYRDAQLALRTAVGSRTLDTLLTDKESVGDEIRSTLIKRADEFGIEVRSVGLRDIILPGEMKTILNRLIEAEKQAQANLIRRREETAAARSQANTAKLLEANPILARMKELEALQEILAGAKTTFVFGAGDLGENVRSLVRQDAVESRKED